jgi:spoIIIJ-associated protein
MVMIDESFYEGKDLEEALQSAAVALGVPEPELHYEIVEQGRRGVFGLGAKSVRIRVFPPLAGSAEERVGQSPRPTPPAPPSPSPADSGAAGEIDRALRQIIGLMGLQLDVRREPGSGEGVTLTLTGEDRKFLKESNGELLYALQFVLNRMARRAWPGAGRIQLTCDGPSRRRDEELVAIAREAAQQVARTGRTQKLQPMNAYERRLVHLVVREFAGLTSSSDGDGSLKRVRISKIQNQI